MKKKIAIVDYGIGNIRSIQHAFSAVGVETELIAVPEKLLAFDKIILPGVGAFDPAMESLRAKGFEGFIKEFVQKDKGKLLGLCLGMQLMLEKSSESRVSGLGLGLVKGEVRSLKELAGDLKIPHMGWNEVKMLNVQRSRLLAGIHDPCFYFVHSYYCKPEGDLTTYTTNYGQDFVSAFETENIMACQFHPEKSHDAGLQILKNFAEW